MRTDTVISLYSYLIVVRNSLWGLSAVNGRQLIIFLGGIYTAVAVVSPLVPILGAMSLEIRLIISLLTGVPGMILLYGGYRLSEMNIHSVLYDRIAGWCVAGIGVMSGILILSATVDGLSDIVPNALILTALGSGAGFEIGLYDAKARTRAREAEQRSRELAYHNNQLENFARSLAHELRNPLTIAQGYHQQSQPQNTEAAQKVTLAHKRIEVMIKELLDSVKRSKVNVEDTPIQLAELAPKVWDNLPMKTESATLHVDTDRTIRGNPIHMEQLLEKLFENSIEHSEEGVVVRIGDLEDGFYVEDDGPGIPDSTHVDAIKGGFTTRGHGMGLGLTIVRQITDLYDWNWTLTESEDGGVRVEFTDV